jgi:hypothetical protein
MCGGRSPKTCVSDVEKQTRSLWNDLKKKAVTREAVGFGGGFGDNASVKVRKATDKPGSPDPFSLANPLVVLGSSQADITAKLKAALQ